LLIFLLANKNKTNTTGTQPVKPYLKVLFVAALAFGSSKVFANSSYFIDQVVNYPSPCTQPTLFDDTASLKSHMDSAGWSGTKFTDGDAWVRDFREACLFNGVSYYGGDGLDSTWADNKSFTVFSGHGSLNTLYFGSNQNACNININNQSRLGSMSGAQAAVAMYIACDVLDLDGSHNPLGGGNEWVNQHLGFHGTTGNQGTRYGSFFDDTSSKSNAQAWLDRMYDQPAVVISYANGTGNCWTVDSNAKLKAQSYTTQRGSGPACTGGQPLYQYCTRWVN
jgi:hypothetical protein